MPAGARSGTFFKVSCTSVCGLLVVIFADGPNKPEKEAWRRHGWAGLGGAWGVQLRGLWESMARTAFMSLFVVLGLAFVGGGEISTSSHACKCAVSELWWGFLRSPGAEEHRPVVRSTAEDVMETFLGPERHGRPGACMQDTLQKGLASKVLTSHRDVARHVGNTRESASVWLVESGDWVGIRE